MTIVACNLQYIWKSNFHMIQSTSYWNTICIKAARWAAVLILHLLTFGVAHSQFTDSTKDISWSQGPLSFDDFRIVEPARKNRPLSVGAVTSSKPGVVISVSEIDLRRILSLSMTNRFNYNKSWVSSDALQDSGLLKHEQGHFDLNEIYTRKTFLQFRHFKFSDNYQAEIARIMKIMNQELNKVQREYERQTLHGLLKENQAFWNQQIANTLRTLPSYEGQVIRQTLTITKKNTATDLRFQ